MSFRLKTIVGVALIEAVLLALLIVRVMDFLQESNLQQLHSRATTTASLFASATKDAVLTLDLAALQEFVDELVAHRDVVYVTVRDADGRLLAERDTGGRVPRALGDDAQGTPDLSDGVFDTGVSISEGGIPFGRVQLGYSARDLQSLLATARRESLLIAGVGMTLVALFSFLLGSYLARGLRALGEGAARVEQGELGYQIPVAGHDEVAASAHAFNAMSRHLEEDGLRRTAILESAMDAIITADADGRILEFNQAAEQTFGYRRQEVKGRLLTETLIPPHLVSSFRRTLYQFHHQSPARITRPRHETTGQRKDGSLVPVEVSLSLAHLPSGPLFTGYLRDISDRLQTEEELRRLSWAVEQSPASVVITDVEGNIQYVNPTFCRITGYPREELLGQNPRILKSGIHDREFYEHLWSTITAGREWRGEICNRCKSGELIWESVAISPLRAPDGGVTHYVGIKEDITTRRQVAQELRLAKERAESASRAKGEFLATMSHEIRTPMNVVIGMADLLLETPLNQDQRHYAQMMQHAGGLLMDLISDILDFAKIEEGRLTLGHHPLNLREVAALTVEVMEMSAREKGLQLTSRFDSDLPEWVVGDGARLRQILVNLLGNAVKFTTQGEVGIEFHPAPDDPSWLQVTVRDSGIGIDPDHLDTIFQPFTQADSTITRRYGGTGLGLAITRRLVVMMGGRIWAESTPGKGSTFHFTLPLELHPTHPEEQSPARGEIPLGGNEGDRGLSVLVAEDSPDNQLLLSSFLKRTPHRLELVDNGADAVARVRSGSYDLVLMDIQMPLLDGYSATREIRAWEREEGRPPIPIVALTAHALEEDRRKSLEAGCNLFLTKPIRKATLLELLGNYPGMVGPAPPGGESHTHEERWMAG